MSTRNLIKIIYASTSGNVEIVCQKIAEILEKADIKAQLFRAEETSIDEIKLHDKFILATSTWEHGVINPFFEPLLAEMKLTDMRGKKAGIVGLGDTRYEPVLFCEGAEILQRVFIAQGGQILSSPLKINGSPYDKLNTVVKDWTKYFMNSLENE